MNRLRDSLLEGGCLLDIEAHDLASIFHQSLEQLVARGLVPAERRDEVEAMLENREQQHSTAIGNSVAVPHAYFDWFENSVTVFVRLVHPLNLGAPDGIPTRFLFLLLGPQRSTSLHLELLTDIAKLMSDGEFRYEAATAGDRDELMAAIGRFEQRVAMPLSQVATSEELAPVRGFGRGVIEDWRRRMAFYVSDFRDGSNRKCFATVLFLFFAVLAPTVAFGALASSITDGQIGVVETLLAAGIGGSIYALFAGQPLSIVASTGPVVVFLGILYQTCEYWSLPYLPTLGWIGLWTSLFTLLAAFGNLAGLVRACTRFTDEIFAMLISTIYIVESLHKLLTASEGGSRYDSLVILLLGLVTFYVAMSLARMRRSRYLRHGPREFLADFGPTIAIVLLTGVSWSIEGVQLPTLAVPEQFGPTADRAWMVDLFAVPVGVRWAAALPAAFAAILLYLDHLITVRLVNSPSHRLRKGGGYHLDLAVMGGMVGLFSLFGLPWIVAATVRSLNHVRSLADVEQYFTPDGDQHERVIRVRENRLTNLVVHASVGSTLLVLPLLRRVPVVVLFGIFLYMGVVSLNSLQFFERLKLWFMDPSLYPRTHYLRRVPTKVVHYYTLIQAACLAALWLVKSSVIAVTFPLVVGLLIPGRWLLNRYFDDRHLDALDNVLDPEEEEVDWSG